MNYIFHEDGAHGWMQVPLSEIEGEEYSSYSYTDDTWGYLEEDCDLPKFLAEHVLFDTEQVDTMHHDYPCFIRDLPRLESAR